MNHRSPGGLLFIGVDGLELTSEEKKLIRRIQPGGVVLFARNLDSPAQTNHLLRSIQDLISIPCFFSIDQEGGRVDRLKKYLPPMPALLKSAEAGAAAVRRHARLTASALRAIGFTMNFAPVLDLYSPFRNGIEDRCLSRDPHKVASLGVAYLKETRRNGIPGTLKHFPGLGRGECDSHAELPVIALHRKQIFKEDLLPFRKALPFSPFVMVAHACYPDLEYCYERPMPASMSRNIISDILRREMAFDGIAMTDDLLMGALKGFGEIEELCEHSLLSGEDMLLICRGWATIERAYRYLSRTRSRISLLRRIAESLERVNDVKSSLGLRASVPELDTPLLEKTAAGMRAFAEEILSPPA